MKPGFSAVVAGHICLDIIPNMQNLAGKNIETVLSPGKLVEVGPALLCTGGAVSNTGLAMDRLGIPTRLVCKVGADPLAETVRSLVARFNPNLVEGMRFDPAASTSYTVIINLPGFDRMFIHSPGANHDFGVEDVDLALVADSTLFHFGYPPIMRRMYLNDGAELVEIFRRVYSLGVTTSLDLSLPDQASDAGRANWRLILNEVLPYVHIFVPSFEELLFMLHRDEYNRLAASGPVLEQLTPAMLHELGDELMRLGVRVALIKLGSRGLYLRTAGSAALADLGHLVLSDPDCWAEREMWAPCFSVQVVGTTGAGDATIAGFLASLLRDFSPEKALTTAVAVGACNVEAADALSGLCSWEGTLARVEKGWDRLMFELNDPYWVWNSDSQLWERRS
jgi:sugar/nucleoside kinase (ribokinase family)